MTPYLRQCPLIGYALLTPSTLLWMMKSVIKMCFCPLKKTKKNISCFYFCVKTTFFLKKIEYILYKIYISWENVTFIWPILLVCCFFKTSHINIMMKILLFRNTTISQYYIVFTICILNVFNRCLDLPVSYSPVYFSKSLQCFHQRLHNTSADIWYTTVSKYSCHMVEQKAFYAVIFLYVFTYIW